jgi:hypothetical protein
MDVFLEHVLNIPKDAYNIRCKVPRLR